MAISAAKLEANRRNAGKSTGPRSEEGKKRSRLNAVTHGLRAETLVLLDEDPQALEGRKKAWRASLSPQDDVEASAVDDAVEYAWLRDRARRAQAARLATNIASAGVDQAKREADEVLRLGQKLFADNRGPLAAYPHIDIEKDLSDKRVSHSELVDDPEDPPRLVLHLQSTAGGCQWMLDQWSELKSILSEGLNWQSADKLKAVRLLGRQPIEAVDDRTVLTIFLACLTMEGKPNTIIPEIWNELSIHERKPYERRLAGRGIDRLRPESAAAARQILLDIIERESTQIKLKAAAHCRRAKVVDALAADCLLFDDSPEGERMRRFELACGRGIWRSLESLRKIRQVTNGPLPVVRGPLPVAGFATEALEEPESTNEPTRERLRNEDGGRKEAPNEAIAACENATNEPTGGPLSVVPCPLKVAGFTAQALDEPRSTNEPAAAHENDTNEPTGGPLSVVRCPLQAASCAADAGVETEATNEPTDHCENETNEPTGGPLSVVSCQWSVASCAAHAGVAPETTNEPTEVCENDTNEPTSGSLSVVGRPLQVASWAAHAVVELNASERSREGEAPSEPRLPREPKFPREGEAPSEPRLPQKPNFPREGEAPSEPRLPREPKFPREGEAPSEPRLPREPKFPPGGRGSVRASTGTRLARRRASPSRRSSIIRLGRSLALPVRRGTIQLGRSLDLAESRKVISSAGANWVFWKA